MTAPPPLRPFGLVLRRDGRFVHEGVPVSHPRLRALFERSVRFLPAEREYVVQVGRFRGQVEVEEAGFFVEEVDVGTGSLRLSDGSVEPLDPATLRESPHDGAWLCTVKRALVPEGLPARFTRAAQAELLLAAEEAAEGVVLHIAGRRHALD